MDNGAELIKLDVANGVPGPMGAGFRPTTRVLSAVGEMIAGGPTSPSRVRIQCRGNGSRPGSGQPRFIETGLSAGMPYSTPTGPIRSVFLIQMAVGRRSRHGHIKDARCRYNPIWPWPPWWGLSRIWCSWVG